MTLTRRTARFRNVVRGPADVWLFARMIGWAVTLPLAKRRLPLVRLVEAAAPAGNPRPAANPEIAIALARWVYRLPFFRDNCLEKSLLTFHYLPANGGRYRLVLGFRGTDQDAPPGHAWLTVDGVPVHDTPEALADLTPVVAFDETGRRRDADGSEGALAPGAPGRGERGAEAEQ